MQAEYAPLVIGIWLGLSLVLAISDALAASNGKVWRLFASWFRFATVLVVFWTCMVEATGFGFMGPNAGLY